MFRAKAYVLEEPAEQLLKYIDVPAFETGDLFYIQNLVTILENPGYGFELSVKPSVQSVDNGISATYTVKVEASGGFTKTITLDASSPSPNLKVNLSAASITPPGEATLTLTDLQTDASLSRGMWYTVPIVATADDIRKIVSVSLLVNAQKVYLPIVE